MTKTHLGILVGLVAAAGLILAGNSFGQSSDKGMGDQKMKADGGHKGGMAKPMTDAGM